MRKDPAIHFAVCSREDLEVLALLEKTLCCCCLFVFGAALGLFLEVACSVHGDNRILKTNKKTCGL